MPSIDRTAQLAALIRTQLGGSMAALAKSGSAVPAKERGGPEKNERFQSQARSSKSNTSAPIEQFVIQRVRSLTPDDPQRRRKTFRIFMESVFLQEFGLDLIEDAGFQRVVDHVLMQMDSDPELRLAMQEAADSLLAQSGGTPPLT